MGRERGLGALAGGNHNLILEHGRGVAGREQSRDGGFGPAVGHDWWLQAGGRQLEQVSGEVGNRFQSRSR